MQSGEGIAQYRVRASCPHPALVSKKRAIVPAGQDNTCGSVPEPAVPATFRTCVSPVDLPFTPSLPQTSLTLLNNVPPAFVPSMPTTAQPFGHTTSGVGVDGSQPKQPEPPFFCVVV